MSTGWPGLDSRFAKAHTQVTTRSGSNHTYCECAESPSRNLRWAAAEQALGADSPSAGFLVRLRGASRSSAALGISTCYEENEHVFGNGGVTYQSLWQHT